MDTGLTIFIPHIVTDVNSLIRQQRISSTSIGTLRFLRASREQAQTPAPSLPA